MTARAKSKTHMTRMGHKWIVERSADGRFVRWTAEDKKQAARKKSASKKTKKRS